MKIEEYFFPDDLFYHKEHFWAKIEGDLVTVGTTDFAQKLAGQIVFVELPSPGKTVEQSKPLADDGSREMDGKDLCPCLRKDRFDQRRSGGLSRIGQ